MSKKLPAGRGFPGAEEIRGNPIPKIAQRKGGKVYTDLSLDLSTSCVGWALGMDKEVVLYGKFVFKSTSDIVGEKLDTFAKYLTILLDVYEPDRVIVEKPLLRRGNTTARHFEMLGLVRAVLFNRLGKELKESWLISPTTVKKALKVRRGNNHDQNKEIMVNRINQLTGSTLRFDANSKYASDDDSADAIALLFTVWQKGHRE